MKQLTTILLTLLVLACTGQEPKELSYYEIENIDSIIADYESQRVADSIRIDILTTSLNSNELITTADTFYIELTNDTISAYIDKKGNEIRLSIIENDNRAYLWHKDGEIQMRNAEGNKQIETWFPEQGIINYK